LSIFSICSVKAFFFKRHCQAARNFSRVSSVTTLPLCTALILAHCSADSLRPLPATDNLALVSSETFRCFQAALILALVSAENFLPFSLALILALC